MGARSQERRHESIRVWARLHGEAGSIVAPRRRSRGHGARSRRGCPCRRRHETIRIRRRTGRTGTGSRPERSGNRHRLHTARPARRPHVAGIRRRDWGRAALAAPHLSLDGRRLRGNRGPVGGRSKPDGHPRARRGARPRGSGVARNGRAARRCRGRAAFGRHLRPRPQCVGQAARRQGEADRQAGTGIQPHPRRRHRRRDLAPHRSGRARGGLEPRRRGARSAAGRRRLRCRTPRPPGPARGEF